MASECRVFGDNFVEFHKLSLGIWQNWQKNVFMCSVGIIVADVSVRKLQVLCIVCFIGSTLPLLSILC